jgi:hypothetical protein
MNAAAPAAPRNRPAQAASGPRSTTWIAFAAGIPLTFAILALLHPNFGLLSESGVSRYLKHSVECVEVLLFCCAVSALAAKFWHSRAERAACTVPVLPPWDGRPAPVGEAPDLLAVVERQPPRWRNTYLGRRLTAILEFLCQRRSAAGLDDHLRALADSDALAHEGSYALTRFITWAIPILGFLGTVLGITEAISGVTPEKLEHDISSLTDGLALAFDATALGLALTMLTMFTSFLVERREQAVLDAVDRCVERHLAHRFQRAGGDAAPVIDAVRQNSQVLVETAGQLVERQARVWAQALVEVRQQTAQVQAADRENLTAALGAALERTLEGHGRRAADLEKKALEQSSRLFEQVGALASAVRETGREQMAALARVGEGVAAQAAALGRLQEGERALVQLQTAMHQNLQALAASGAFDQAVHSLTAAIHLLTARAGAAALPGAGEQAVLKFPPPGAGKGPSGKAA